MTRRVVCVLLAVPCVLHDQWHEQDKQSVICVDSCTCGRQHVIWGRFTYTSTYVTVGRLANFVEVCILALAEPRMTTNVRDFPSISNNRWRRSHDDGDPVKSNITVQDCHGRQCHGDSAVALLGDVARGWAPP